MVRRRGKGKKKLTPQEQIDEKRKQRAAAKKMPPKEKVKVPEDMSVRQYVRACNEFQELERRTKDLQAQLGKTQRTQIAAEGRCEGITLMIAEACGVEDPEKKTMMFDGAEFQIVEGDGPGVHMGLDKKVFREWEATEEKRAEEEKAEKEQAKEERKGKLSNDEWVVKSAEEAESGSKTEKEEK